MGRPYRARRSPFRPDRHGRPHFAPLLSLYGTGRGHCPVPFLASLGDTRPGCFAWLPMLATFVTMATRVRTEPARQPGTRAGQAGAGQRAANRGTSENWSGQPPRRKASSGRKRSTTARSAGKGKKRPPGRPNRRPPARPPAPRNPVAILAIWIARTMAKVWMLLANGLGL